MADRDITFMAKCNFRGNQRVFGVKRKDRRQHMYVIGKTGVGKTALLKNLALQDIRAGHGVGIIDPHGEFVEEVTSQIPSERLNDVVYFNPVDSDFPIGFNVLEVPDMKYKHLVVSDLLGIFTKIWANVWSARMEYILQNCILALLDTPGTTLLGIPRILTDKDYRQRIISNVKDPVVRSFWVHEFETWRDQFRNEAIVPIQNKVGQFLNTPFIRNIVGQPKSTMRIPDIMNEGKILLVNVSKGRIGEDNSALLGAMIITKVQLAAMERVRIPEEDRTDFYMYVDEFQNFATESFASILSEARKYRLNIIIAHQYVGQLITDTSTKVRDAVFGNVGTMISFRVGAADAEALEKEFMPEFMMNDLINLPNYHIYLKLMVDGMTSRPFSAVTLPPIQFESDPAIKEKILSVSRKRYGRPLAEVEKQILQWGESGGGETEEAGGGSAMAGSVGGKFEATCWNCGKKTTVPFKPDGKRPVYCQTCYKQIDEGKLVPIHERMPQVGREKFGTTLGAIGIEFDAVVGGGGGGGTGGGQNQVNRQRPPQQENRSSSDSRRPPNREGQKVERRPFTPGVRSRPVVRASTGKSISLSHLKSGDTSGGNPQPKGDNQHMRQRGSVDTSELRKVLEETLHGGDDAKKSQPNGAGKGNGSGMMKPGESVKL
jgi:CxxC-x17-CxxC domain-containing protein